MVLPTVIWVLLGAVFTNSFVKTKPSVKAFFDTAHKKQTPLDNFWVEELDETEIDGENDNNDDHNDSELASSLISVASSPLIFGVFFNLQLHAFIIKEGHKLAEPRLYILFHSLKLDC